jgi:hypothetical protein
MLSVHPQLSQFLLLLFLVIILSEGERKTLHLIEKQNVCEGVALGENNASKEWNDERL